MTKLNEYQKMIITSGQNKMGKETLEEAAENHQCGGYDWQKEKRKSFIDGAKWMKKQSKAMEKEQKQRFNKFLNDEMELGISDKKTIERIQWYYNNYLLTFKSE